MKKNRHHRRGIEALQRKNDKKRDSLTKGLQDTLELVELLPIRHRLRITWQILTKYRTREREDALRSLGVK